MVVPQITSFIVGSFINKGTKNVAKELKKICRGAVRGRDVTWFTQLSDKGVYIHVLIDLCYWSTLVYCT